MADLNDLENYSISKLFDELMTRRKRRSRHITDRNSAVNNSLAQFDSQSSVSVLKNKHKVIYGRTDDRLDFFQIHDQLILRDLDSVISLLQASDIKDKGNGQSELQTVNFGESQNLCDNERFREQPIGAFCSGFLVGPDLIATTGHCVKNSSDLQDTRFVFGYRMENQNQARTIISNSDIYKGKEIVGRRLDPGQGSDWCIVRLDRHVTNHSTAIVGRSGLIDDAQNLHVIGHPCGLPVKFASGSKVRDNQSDVFFVANLDVFGGNAGSPVFNSKTHEVEGILVRGDVDFAPIGDCNVSMICPNTGCTGYDCTRVTALVDRIP